MLVLAQRAHAQAEAFYYEIGVDAAQGPLSVTLYNAISGETYWLSTVVNRVTNGPDIGFNVGGPAGSVTSTTQNNGFINVTVPSAGVYVIEFAASGLAPIAFAWGDNGDYIPNSPEFAFYKPVALQGTPDSFFTFSGGQMHVSLIGGAGTTADLTALLGERGWTLPYDRETLCSARPGGVCQTGTEPTQFISAGVATVAVPGSDSDRRLVPTFEFAGSVVPLASWGTVTWDTPDLTLRFKPLAHLPIAGYLNASGARLTATNPSQGWGGVHFAAGSGGA